MQVQVPEVASQDCWQLGEHEWFNLPAERLGQNCMPRTSNVPSSYLISRSSRVCWHKIYQIDKSAWPMLDIPQGTTK